MHQGIIAQDTELCCIDQYLTENLLTQLIFLIYYIIGMSYMLTKHFFYNHKQFLLLAENILFFFK